MRSVLGKGLGVKELMIEAAGIIGAGADAGAGIHTEEQAFRVHVIGDIFHPVREFYL